MTHPTPTETTTGLAVDDSQDTLVLEPLRLIRDIEPSPSATDTTDAKPVGFEHTIDLPTRVTPKTLYRVSLQDFEHVIKVYASVYAEPMLRDVCQLYLNDLEVFANAADHTDSDRRQAWRLAETLHYITKSIRSQAQAQGMQPVRK